MKLTREQKILVLCSLIYVIFIYLAADIHLKHNDDMLRFMIFTIPVWGYWSGVWIYGFGWLRKLWRTIRNFVYMLFVTVTVGVGAFSTYQEIQLRKQRELEKKTTEVTRSVDDFSFTPIEDGEEPDVDLKVAPEGFSFMPIEDDFDPWKIKPQYIEKDEERDREPVNAPVVDTKNEYRELPEALEYELRRIRNINSD